MNILVPTDFSEIADNAIAYACMLAKRLQGKIVLLHVIPPNSIWWTSFSSELVTEAMQKQKLIKERLVSKGINTSNIITCTISDSPLTQHINNLILEYNIDFVVMGTHGSGGLLKTKLGSFTMGMIDNIPIPVIAIPAGGKALPIRHILYPTDMEDVLSETRKLVPLAKAFDATIHIVHIPGDDIGSKIFARHGLLEICKLTGYAQITTEVAHSGNIIDVIDEHLATTNSDLLIMFAHEKDFFEKLFKGSRSEQMSRHIQVPLLVFRKAKKQCP